MSYKSTVRINRHILIHTSHSSFSSALHTRYFATIQSVSVRTIILRQIFVISYSFPSQIGVEFALKVINWDPKTEIRLQLWDIAGQERFGNMTRVSDVESLISSGIL